MIRWALDAVLRVFYFIQEAQEVAERCVGVLLL